MILSLLTWTSVVGIGLPTIIVLIASWHDLIHRHDRPSLRAPRRRQPLTVIIYHTNFIGTRESLKALRRITSLSLDIILVIPSELQSDAIQVRHLARTYQNVRVHCTLRSASRALTIASCYRNISPAASVLILDSGDIASAATIHSARRLFTQHATLTTLFIERTRQLGPTLPSILALFAALARQLLYGAATSLHMLPSRSFPAGTLLRSGYQLRTNQKERCAYIRVAPIIQTTTPQFPVLRPLAFVVMLACLVVVGLCYYLAASLQTAQPLILVWILCAWWAITAMSTYRPLPRADPFLLVSIIPLMGIIAPVTGVFTIFTTLRHWLTLLLRQSLTWARRQYAGHSVFFGTRHP